MSSLLQTVLVIVGLVVALVILAAGLIVYAKKSQAHKKAPGTKYKTDPNSTGPQINAQKITEEEGSRMVAMRTRLVALGAVVSGIISVLFFKTWSMQLVQSNEYVSLAEDNRTRVIPTKAPRGRILDRNGQVIVGNRASMVVMAQKDVLKDELLIKRLANVLGMPYAAVRRNIRDESQGAAAPRMVAMDVPMQTVSYIAEHPSQFPHITIESRSVRAYPHANMAAHLLGYTGPISQEDLERNKQNPDASITYQMGDVIGKTGLEAQYESVLQGIPGSQTLQVDAHGRVTKFLEEVAPIPGSDIQLSIDIDIQKATEKYLLEAIKIAKDIGRNSTGGACVVLDPKDGSVIAMASYPTFDPTAFIGGIGAETWEDLTSDESHNPLTNRVIAGLYPAASTIKAFSAISALEYGIATPETGYNCAGKWKGFGEAWFKWCWLHSGHGGQNIRTGIINSCDSVFYSIAKDFWNSNEPEGLQHTFRDWGLDSKTGIDLPGEQAGRIPDAEWKAEYFKNYPPEDRQWRAGDTTNIVIGQGDVLVTPLQMAHAFCALNNNGKLIKPRLLSKVLAQGDNKPLIETSPEVTHQATVEPQFLELVLEAQRGVISNTTLSRYYENMEHKVAGKTGTAEVASKGDYAWFVGYAPYESPDYCIAMIVEQGGGGGTSAAPAVRKIFGHIYDEPMPEISIKVDNTR